MNAVAKKAKEAFVDLIRNVPPEQWDRRLAEECGGDEQLRCRVRVLLRAHREAGSFLMNEPAIALQIDQPSPEQPCTQIGPYKLLQVIGEGGMGVVYMAQQTEPVERHVALKTSKAGMDSGQSAAHLEAEGEALAMMDHPNIAKVLDAGTIEVSTKSDAHSVKQIDNPNPNVEASKFAFVSDFELRASRLAPIPYLVMELVKGIPITRYCNKKHLTLIQRLELFIPVCQAIQHAHQKGIIHCDLKPGNVLVAEYDKHPVPKVIDFGVAKAISKRLREKTMITEYGQIMGTLEYMSPEQTKPNQFDIDARSDIYSLGVLLYELLTGTTPIDEKRLRTAMFDEMLRMIREEKPPKPSIRLSTAARLPSIAANRGVERGELDWIVMKCLEKDPNRRYQSANDLARDIERYLANALVEETAKLVRRNRVLLTAAVLILVGFVAGAEWGKHWLPLHSG